MEKQLEAKEKNKSVTSEEKTYTASEVVAMLEEKNETNKEKRKHDDIDVDIAAAEVPNEKRATAAAIFKDF